MEAEKKNIYGFVKNRTENEVEAVLLGEDIDVNELVKLARKGPSSAHVKKLSIQNYQEDYPRKSFGFELLTDRARASESAPRVSGGALYECDC